MTTTDESDQVVQRRANLNELRALGVDPYPRRFDTLASIDAVVQVGELVLVQPVHRIGLGGAHQLLLGVVGFGQVHVQVGQRGG